MPRTQRSDIIAAAAYVILLELEHRQVLQDVVLDACSILCANPVLGSGPHKALGTILVLHTACVSSQVTVDVTQVHQHVTVVTLQAVAKCHVATCHPCADCRLRLL